jgi:serine/threonine protein kinase
MVGYYHTTINIFTLHSTCTYTYTHAFPSMGGKNRPETLGIGGFGRVYKISEHTVCKSFHRHVDALQEWFMLDSLRNIPSIEGHPIVPKLVSDFVVCRRVDQDNTHHGRKKRKGNSNDEALVIDMEMLQAPSKGSPHVVQDPDTWFHSVISGLQSLHVLGLVHADVKPDNILGRRGEHVVLCDMGLARGWDDAMTHRERAYTSSYCPPESSENAHMFIQVTDQSDMWAAAASFLGVFSGFIPDNMLCDEGEEQNRLRLLHHDLVICDARTQWMDEAHAPPTIRPFLCQCLEFDPHRRPKCTNTTPIQSWSGLWKPGSSRSLEWSQVEHVLREVIDRGIPAYHAARALAILPRIVPHVSGGSSAHKLSVTLSMILGGETKPFRFKTELCKELALLTKNANLHADEFAVTPITVLAWRCSPGEFFPVYAHAPMKRAWPSMGARDDFIRKLETLGVCLPRIPAAHPEELLDEVLSADPPAAPTPSPPHNVQSLWSGLVHDWV